MEISYPQHIHAFDRARAIARKHGIELQAAGDSWGLSHPAAPGEHPRELKHFFAELNDLRAPYPPVAPGELAGRDPLVTCVVAVNENLPFFCEQLLPSLVVNSRKHAIEIIVVCNGSASYDHPALPGLRGVRSDWGSVSKAYNAGARAGRGEVLAFFHDDCIVRDCLWIEKSLQRLERGAHAVAGEYRSIDLLCGVNVPPLPVAKCVPLVLRRADFESAGGFDEYHYVGYEDLDFTLALARLGKKLVATDLDIVHFHGMSTTLKYNPVPGLRELYAMTAVPRVAVMQRFKEFWPGGLEHDGINYLQLAMDLQLLYVLEKYRDFLSRIHASAYAAAESALERAIGAAGASDREAALERFRQIDRSLPAALPAGA